MSYHKKFIINFCLLIAVALSYGAENNKKNDFYKIQEIKIVPVPLAIKYISNNTVAINSVSLFSIVDLEAKTIMHIDNRYHNREYRNLPILYSNDKTIFSSTNKKLSIYDEQKNVKTHFISRKNSIQGLAIHPNSNTVFLCCPQRKIITKCNYRTRISEDVIIPGEGFSSIDIHPKKGIMCIARSSGNLSFHRLSNLQKSFKTITFIKPINTIYFFCRYSLDGSCIAVWDNEIVHIIDPDKNTYCSLKPFKNEIFNIIAFHPDSLTLATLAARNPLKADVKTVIHYWDLKTKECIYTTSELGDGYACDISFSPDGLEVIVVIKNKCIRTLVPFAVNKKCIDLLFWLNQLKEQEKIPQDIVRYSINAFLRHLRF